MNPSKVDSWYGLAINENGIMVSPSYLPLMLLLKNWRTLCVIRREELLHTRLRWEICVLHYLTRIPQRTETNGSETAESSFYKAFSKPQFALGKAPKFKLVTLRDFNATISSQSKTFGDWDSVLCHNNSDRVVTNDIGERFLTWRYQMLQLESGSGWITFVRPHGFWNPSGPVECTSEMQ